MRATSAHEVSVPEPPYTTLAARLHALAGSIESRSIDDATELRTLIAGWEGEQRQWDERLSALLALHHDINNALVGVRGNAQLLLMGPVGQQAGTKERLEIIIRESTRIREAASVLRELKHAISGNGPTSHAA